MPARSVKLRSPAKLNLFLEVTGRRKDGYHTLETLFAKLDLHDTLEVRVSKKPGVGLRMTNTSGTPVPAGRENLAVRAAEAFRSRFGVKAGVEVRLTKRIPAGAGLGGGSSNAGTTLRALARLFPGPGRDLKTLAGIAESLGADVPLFVRPGGLFAGRGVGEKLAPVRAKRPLPPALLLVPRVQVPTADAYRFLGFSRRRRALTGGPRLDRLVAALSTGKPFPSWSGLLFNRLEEAVLPRFRGVADAKRALVALGAPALMTGSGSCVFAFVSGPAEGRRLARRLKAGGRDARLVRIAA